MSTRVFPVADTPKVLSAAERTNFLMTRALEPGGIPLVVVVTSVKVRGKDMAVLSMLPHPPTIPLSPSVKSMFPTNGFTSMLVPSNQNGTALMASFKVTIRSSLTVATWA